MGDKLNDPDYSSGVAAFEAKNFSLAMQFLSPLAEGGDVDAQHRAVCPRNGNGMASDGSGLNGCNLPANSGNLYCPKIHYYGLRRICS